MCRMRGCWKSVTPSVLAVVACATAAAAQEPPAIAAPGETVVATLHAEGAVVGKAVGNAPGKSASDIPWLKLEVTAHRGSGALSGVTTVQRINTAGGVHAGACDKAGTFHSAPYAADYVFLRKGP